MANTPRAIERVLNEQYMRRFFQRHLQAITPSGRRITFLYSKYLHFLSSASFIVRYELDVQLRSGRTVTRYLWGNRLPLHAYRVMEYAWKHLPRRVPQPLYYFKPLRFGVYQEVVGRTLGEFDQYQLPLFLTATPPVAQNLARLHNLAPAIAPRQTAAATRAHLALINARVRQHNQALSPRVTALTTQLQRALEPIVKKGQFVITHGDYQASNTVYNLRRKKAGIIDFAETAQFDPAHDVATFLINALKNYALIAPRSFIAAVERRFLNAYYATAKPSVARLVRQHLGLFTIRTCLDLIATLSVFMEYNRSPYYRRLIQLLLTHAEAHRRALT